MRSLKVLILEDNPFQLMALHQMLNANQVFDVLTADSVEAAQRSLDKRGTVDIAICDLHMQGQDGVSMLGYLARTGLAGAVIILSSAECPVLDSAAQLARQQGIEVLGTLQKPASTALIGELLQQFRRIDSTLENARKPASVEPLTLVQLQQRTLGDTSDADLDTREWIAHFQPKVNLNGELMGVELLARWQHPIHGLLMAGRFLPALQQAGLLDALTWQMLERALTLSSERLQVSGRALPVAVNVSPIMLGKPDFVPRLQALLERFAVLPKMLTLEVLEQSARPMAVAQFENLLRLRMAGCRLSIDDFGTGASNIQRLLELPFNELKIPVEFVRGLAEDRRKAAVISGVMCMARQMALDVVVEGVETVDDYQALLMLGNPTIQGYFIARPMAETALLRWLDVLEHHPGQVLAL